MASIASKVAAAQVALTNKTGRIRHLISDLQKQSGVPLKALQDHLLKYVGQTVNASRGEFTAATPAQQKAALLLDDGPHLYAEIFPNHEAVAGGGLASGSRNGSGGRPGGVTGG